MQQVVYALRFTGQAEPVGHVGNVLRAATSAPSSTLTSRVGADGLTSTLLPAPGTEATFASEVTFTGETSFLEIGTITFGGDHVLQFSTIGSGYLAPSADPKSRVFEVEQLFDQQRDVLSAERSHRDGEV